MIKKHYTDVKRIENKIEGFKGMFQRFLWTKDDGCQNFAMRLMEFEPNGHTSYHSHLEEHEFFFLEGEAEYIDADGNETRLRPGDTVYVPPEEPHQLKNVGNNVMKVICIIPILLGGDGKKTAPRPDGKDIVKK